MSKTVSQFNIDYLIEVFETMLNEKPGIRRNMLQSVLLRELKELENKNQRSAIDEFYKKINLKNKEQISNKLITQRSQSGLKQYVFNVQSQSGVYINDDKIIILPANQNDYSQIDLKNNKSEPMSHLSIILNSKNGANNLMAIAHSDEMSILANPLFFGLTNSSIEFSDYLERTIFLNRDFFIQNDNSGEFRIFKKMPNKKEKFEEIELQLKRPIFIGNMNNDIHLFISNNNLLIYNSKSNQSEYRGLPAGFDFQNDWHKIVYTENEIYIPSENEGRFYFERLTFSNAGNILGSTVSINAHGKDEIFKFIKNHQDLDYRLSILPSNKGKQVLFEIYSQNLNQSGLIEKIGLLIDYSDHQQFTSSYLIFEYTNDSDFYVYDNHFYFKSDQFSAFEISKLNKNIHTKQIVIPKSDQIKNHPIGATFSDRSYKNNLEIHLDAENEADIYLLSTREHKHLRLGLPQKSIVQEVKFVSNDDYLMITYFLQNKKYLMFFPTNDLK